MDFKTLTRIEQSVLLYAETCVVDDGGLLEGQRMNSDDITALKAFQEKGVLTFGRIPFAVLETLRCGSRAPTHWVTFADEAWRLAHALRRHVAETRTSASRKKVDAVLQERAAA